MTIPPILLITFNRPHQTRQVINALRLVRPTRLFVANDGPRAARPQEASLCAEIRNELLKEIDWPCEMKTLFQDENLGCRRGVQAAISWFFSQVDEGIILEDDIVPHPSFFAYQAELLERYRHDPEVMVVSGHQPRAVLSWKESYRFSRFAAIWGWGTWKRVWDLYEPLAETFFQEGEADRLKKYLRSPELVDWWQGSLRAVADGRLDTWDVQLCYLLMRHEALCAVPRVRMVQNIGFGEDATHTVGKGDEAPPRTMPFPLIHPTQLKQDVRYDRNHARSHFWNRHARWTWRLVQGLKRILKGRPWN